MLDRRRTAEAEKAIGYMFTDKSLIAQALTHSSYGSDNNQRLEFLGDAVLELIVSEELYMRRAMREGRMSKLRAELVREKTLAELARERGIGELLLLGAGEENTGGRDKPSILADAVESMLGAVYLDGGYEAARRVTLELYGQRIESVLDVARVPDYKSRLQELCHKQSCGEVCYETYREEGPPHDMTFYVRVYIGGREKARGVGRSKKLAEQNAAEKAIALLTEP